jgi:hypothetical protein
MYKKSNNNRNIFSMSGGVKKKGEPMPIFQTDNNPVAVIRSDVGGAFTLGQSKKYSRSSGLEK